LWAAKVKIGLIDPLVSLVLTLKSEGFLLVFLTVTIMVVVVFLTLIICLTIICCGAVCLKRFVTATFFTIKIFLNCEKCRGSNLNLLSKLLFIHFKSLVGINIKD